MIKLINKNFFKIDKFFNKVFESTLKITETKYELNL